MKKYIAFLSAVAATMGAYAADVYVPAAVPVDSVVLEHDGSYMNVGFNIALDSIHCQSNRAILITPKLVNGADSLVLPSVGIYGRQRYYYYTRNTDNMLTDENETSFRAGKTPGEYSYSQILPYQEWMNGSMLNVTRRDYGCCSKLLGENTRTIGDFTEYLGFFPDLVYVQPVGEAVKERALEGSAFIDFVVDKTDIRPSYRNNRVELAKINASIDSVKNDSDITITQVWLKGYASPEASWRHNTRLARNRTASLKDYVQSIYHFQDGIIETDFQPEDWDGLRRYVASHSMPNQQAILDLIDSDMDPDAKEAKIKRLYPEEYAALKRDIYPALRHTDYRIAYVVRTYTDTAEIRRVLHSAPQNLSLNEFYLASEGLEPGSDEFTEVFETAVRMYPTDESANLNAANAALRRDDFNAARRYLAKAGNSPEATYARGALAIREGRIDEGKELMQQAADAGIAQANDVLEQLAAGRR